MTEKERLAEIARRKPVPPVNLVETGLHRLMLLKFFTAAVVTLVLLFVVFLFWQDRSHFQEQQRAERARTAAIADLATSNAQLLAELEAAVAQGPAAQADAILAVINDNRRIHGCTTVESFADLSTAPRCTFTVAKQTSPTTSTTAPRRTVTPTTGTTTPTTRPPATTTTGPCKLGLPVLGCVVR